MRRILTACLSLALISSVCPAFASAAKAKDVPKILLITLNINADDSKGKEGRSLVFIDVAAGRVWNLPLSMISGGPLEGQPMHAVLSLDKKRAYLTMGGNQKLPLRLAVVELDWASGSPAATLVKTVEVLPANTEPIGMMAGMTAMAPAMQEGHGPHLTSNGRYLLFSELNNNRLRVFNTKTDEFVGAPIAHPTLKTPHGVYPNSSMTRAMSTQYQLNGNEVSIWKLNSTTGEMTFDKAVTMADGPTLCAYTHTAAWLDEDRFYTNCTQEANQGAPNTSERSVWLVDAAKGTATAVLKSSDVLEGVSDVAIARGKLYVAEGNIEKTGTPPGHISIWDIKNDLKPAFIKRFSAGKGLPATYADTHELAVTPDGHYVFAESFRSGFVVKIDAAKDSIIKTWSAAEGLSMPHGFDIR
jgi:DNA-binding beta-propeller fold protein YncE